MARSLLILARGQEDKPLSVTELEELCEEALIRCDLKGQKVLVIIPDSTRTAPMPRLFRVFHKALLGQVKRLDLLIALGTHPPMTEEEIGRHLGLTQQERGTKSKLKDIKIFNHHWDSPKELKLIGKISREEMERLSSGLLKEEVPITINRRIFNYDHLIILGPVFPHEVVGFSGGYKYFFPGISGPEMLHRSHWLGALITNPKINGVKWTPVREMIHYAASFVNIPTTLFALVMKRHEVHGLYVGDPIDAWEAAADLSAKVNIVWKDHPYVRVLSMAPAMYKDLWTAGKCMYKLEPVVKDGGKLIIYGPHIEEISYTHGKLIRNIGYHTRDYFLKQWERFKDIPGAILAHSTHVRGIGTYRKGEEWDRIEVILATNIPKEVCEEINLGYMNPAEIDPKDYAGKEDEGVLLVREAGEMLYRLSDGTVPDIDKL
jgi:nickel-dependent lactate racemase